MTGNGRVSWFEVVGRDGDALRAFYGELFGWKLVPHEGSDYHVTPDGWDGVPGGVGTVPQGQGWATFYVKVDDVEAAVARAVGRGGRVLMPRTDLPHGTTIAVVADPEGHPVGLSCTREA